MDTFLGLDATLLARIQFGFTVSFHFIFPSISIGLASYLAVLNGLYLWTRDEVYLRVFNFWVKIFAIAFGMGVVSGIVMSYQFGTNWSVFSDLAGPVVGPLMAYEVLTAFFLEAGFLGIMLFGREKVGPGLHMFATAMVAVGTAISATWILSVNSWMQTPQGFGMNADGQFIPEDWWAIVFTPSFPYRLAHTLTAAYLTTAFIVGGVGGWQLLRGRAHNAAARRMFSMAMWMIVVTAPLQVMVGHEHGLNTLEHQPVKIAAMEGHFHSHEDGAPLILFGLPDQEAGEMRYELSIPHLSSVIFGLGWNGAMEGLDVVPDEEEPPVAVIFWSFRVMVGLGFLMVGAGLWGLYARWRGHLYASPWLWRAMVAMGPSGLVAVIAGWITTEVGRQPYVVYNQLRTADAVSPLGASAVGWSLIAFIVIYFAVFGAGVLYILRLMHREPDTGEQDADAEPGPTRAAGITPQQQMDRGRAAPAE